jgi:hypothetical protein
MTTEAGLPVLDLLLKQTGYELNGMQVIFV